MFQFEPVEAAAGFRMPGYYIWCSSVIYSSEEGLYHMFASRWNAELPFHPGWLTNSEVVRATSPNLTGPYEFAEVVLPARGAEYWDGCMTHNPRILKYGDRYLLFYIGSTYPFASPQPGEPLAADDPRAIVARSNKRIGIAVADSLSGPWRRPDSPALATKPGTFYSFFTSNPSPVVEEDGGIYLMFKSRRYEGFSHSRMYLGAARAASPWEPFEVVTPEPLFSGAGFELEDPFVWKTPDGGYRLIAKDMDGAVCGTAFDGLTAESEDGVHWKNPRKAYTRTVRYSDGTETRFALRERPFLFLNDGVPEAFFTAVAPIHPYGAAEKVETWNLVQRLR